MKKIITSILFLVTLVSYSQDNIVPLEERNLHSPFETPKIYYKDVNGILDKFIGTWRYQDNPTNPTKIFEITFYKKEHSDYSSSSFNDELVSRFSYTSNGTVIYDTYLGDYEGHISGSGLMSNDKMDLHYSEPIIDGTTVGQNPNSRIEIEFQMVNGLPTLSWYNGCELDQNHNSPFRIPLLMTLNKI